MKTRTYALAIVAAMLQIFGFTHSAMGKNIQPSIIPPAFHVVEIASEAEWSHVHDVSNAGMAAGEAYFSEDGQFVTKAFAWNPSWGQGKETKYLFDIPGLSNIDTVVAYGANDQGMVVGYVSHGGTLDAFRWNTNTDTVELITTGSFNFGIATSINNQGMITGAVGNVFNNAAIWEEGALQPIITPGWTSTANASNNSGITVGESRTFTDILAFRFFDNTVTILPPLPLSDTSHTNAVNESGTVVGSSGGHAVMWPMIGGVLDLGTLPTDHESVALGINDHGVVVGSSGVQGNSRGVIFWGGRVIDIAPICGTITQSANDINNLGWIAANGASAMVLIPDWDPYDTDQKKSPDTAVD